jgi:hypothetical protein
VKTWHAAIASFGTAAFLVGAYIAVLSVSGALFAFTDLSNAGTARTAPPLKTVVAVKPVKVKPVVARVPEPEPAPEPEPVAVSEPEPLVEPLQSSSYSAPASSSSDGGNDGGGGGQPSFGGGGGGGGGNGGGNPSEGDRDGAALLSKDGVNVSGPAKNLTDTVNKGLNKTTGGVDLHKVTDPAVKLVDRLERGLGLDRQGR